MYDRELLCRKITELFPEIGACDINLEVDYDSEQEAWKVHLEQGPHRLDTYLNLDEAKQCMDGKQCVSLGLQIAQLQTNIRTA